MGKLDTEELAAVELDAVTGGGPTDCIPDIWDFYKIPDYPVY